MRYDIFLLSDNTSGDTERNAERKLPAKNKPIKHHKKVDFPLRFTCLKLTSIFKLYCTYSTGVSCEHDAVPLSLDGAEGFLLIRCIDFRRDLIFLASVKRLFENIYTN